MPKPRPKSLPAVHPTNPATLLRRHKVLSILIATVLIVGLSVVGTHIYNHYAVKADRARFTRAEQDISNLSNAIIAATGQPLKVTSEKFCSRPSVELGDSPLSCDIDKYYFYSAENDAAASAIYKKANSVVENEWMLRSNEHTNNSNADSFNPLNKSSYVSNIDYEQILHTYQLMSDRMTCNASYVFYNSAKPPYSNYSIASKSLSILALEIGCSGGAKSQYYLLNSLK